MNPNKPNMIRTLIVALVLVASFHTSAAVPAAAPDWKVKVDPALITSPISGDTEFLVILNQQADLRKARSLKSKQEKGRFVYQQLTRISQDTQKPILDFLQTNNVEHRSFWITNSIWVRGDAETLQELAGMEGVSRIIANPSVELELPEPLPEPDSSPGISSPAAVEWNIQKVNAPQVWQRGYTGQGVVIGGQDTGYDWDHPALINKYRGYDSSTIPATVDHNYNWHDAIHVGGHSCGPDSPVPCDDYNHGTHTMGTMVGDDGAGNQIGMAPGAKWIGCRNMDGGVGKPSTYMECFQWFLAPTDLNNNNPNITLAPHVINNSWYCDPNEGCLNWYDLKATVDNVRAAGIVVVVAAGNTGPACGSVDFQPAIYDSSFSVGATTNYDFLATFSSRGPSDDTILLKPDVTAPGQSVRSSVPGTGYSTMSGTSMAAPHVTGLVALLLSARPALKDNVDAIEYLITRNAFPKTTGESCGGIPGDQIPNNSFGWGRIDAYETLFDTFYFPFVLRN